MSASNEKLSHYDKEYIWLNSSIGQKTLIGKQEFARKYSFMSLFLMKFFTPVTCVCMLNLRQFPPVLFPNKWLFKVMNSFTVI